MDTKLLMLDALRKKYEAQIADAYASALVYLNSAVGIGEHPQHIDEVDKLIAKIAEAEEKLGILEGYKL